MYKLLIVEDERWEREGLINLLRWEELGIGDVRCAADGQEGYDAILQEVPDIIITDIRMPGMDGLQMLEKAAGMLHKTKCLILSGYNEFDYAKKAMHLGAKEFLLKPINQAETEMAIRRAVAALNEEKLREKDQSQMEKYRLLGLIESGESRGDAQAGLTLHQGMRVVVIKGCDERAAIPPSLWQVADLDGDLVIILLEGQMFPVLRGKAVGYKVIDGEDIDLPRAYRQAKDAAGHGLFWSIMEPVSSESLARKGENESREFRPLLDGSWGQKLSGALRAVDGREAMYIAKQLFIDFKAYKAYKKPSVVGFLLPLLGELATQNHYAVEEDLAQSLQGMENIGEMEAFVLRFLEALLEHNQQRLGHTEEYVIKKVQEIIKAEYANNGLTLRAVAAKVFLSPNYVGSLFKKLSGCTFSDYLCRYRMQKAAELLKEPGRKVNWVAKNVGIPNTSYFCILFKEEYGVSPSVYQRGLHRQ